MVGTKLDDEWTAFGIRSGTLDVPRADMPQVKAEHRGALVTYLKARGVEHASEEVEASSLKPTQREFAPGKVQKAREFVGGDRSILVSADNHVLDGHHQWMAKLEAGEKVKVIRLAAPIKQLLDDVKEFPSSEVAEGSTPAAPETKEKSDGQETRPVADKRAEGGMVIRNKATGETIMETTDQKKVDALNTDKYEAVPVMQHLQEMNDPESKVRKYAERPAEPAAPAKAERGVVRTSDGKEFKPSEAKLVGSVSKVSGRDVHKPAVVGEFPVFVEQSGNYRLFTYNKKIASIDGVEEAAPKSEPQATTKPQAKKPKATAAEPWRTSITKARAYAKELGISTKNKSILALVEQIDATLADTIDNIDVNRIKETMADREKTDAIMSKIEDAVEAQTGNRPKLTGAAEPDAEDAPAFSVKGSDAIPGILKPMASLIEGKGFEAAKRAIVAQVGSVGRSEKFDDDVADAVFMRLQRTAQVGRYNESDVAYRKAKRLTGEGNITLYRAAPKGGGIRPGDFATDSKNEAGYYKHGSNVIQSAKVPRRDVIAVEGSSGGAQEYVYLPENHTPAKAVEHFKSFREFFDAVNQPAAFSVSDSNGTMTAATLREKLSNGRQFGGVIDSLIESGQVVLHDTTATLPGALKGREGVQAVTMPNGTIHMVASNLTPRNARAVLLHEAFHAGAEALIGGKAWTALMGKLASLSRQAKSTNGAANAFWKAAQQRVADARAQDAVTPQMELEEFGAYAIEEYESAPLTVKKWVDDLVGAVKAWLVARFGKQLGDVTPAQLSALARMALRDAVAERSGAMQEAFSMGEARTIEVDGVRRPITNSKGQPLGDTFAKQKAFWNWAGDTKVVDEQGRPMVVYHGTTKDFAAFDAARLGENTKHITAKMGFFFSPAPEVTDIFTETIDETQWPFKLTSKDGASTMPVYLNIKNPLEMTVASFRELEPWTRAELAAKGYDGVRIIGDPKLAGTYGGEEWKVDTWVALNPEQVKSATGNSGAFDGNNPDIRFSVAGAAPAGAQSGANADTGLTPNDTKWTDMLRRVQATVQDNMNRVKQVQERIAKVTGQKLSEMTDYYGAETNRPGRIAARLEDGERGMFAPLMEKLAKAGHTPEQLEELLHAMHATERNETVARINPDNAAGSGMTDAKAAEIVERYEGAEFKVLREVADDAREVARQTLNLKRTYGLLTPERHEQLTTHYEFYVPLKGDGEYGVKVKQAMGHDAREEFIMENIVRDFKQAVIAGEKNIARQFLLRMILKNPDPKLWTVGVPPKGRYVAGKVYNIMRNGERVASLTSQAEVTGFLEGKGREASQYQVVDSRGEQVAEFTKQLQDNEVMVYINGDPVRIQILDEKLAEQIRPMSRKEMGMMLKFSGSLNRWYSKVYTGYNPAFILRNAARDAGTGTINMLGNYGGTVAAKAWARYPVALAVLFNWARTGKIPRSAAGDMLREYRSHGGKVGASHMGDLEAQGQSLTRMYEDSKGAISFAKDGKMPKAAWIAARKSVRALAHVVEVLNQATENALRLSLYMEMKAQGASASKAAQAAKTVTVDFDRKGSATGALSAAYLFFNPAVQGTANGFKTMVKGAKREQAWAAIAGLSLLGYYLATQGMDDDKDRWLGEKWDIRAKNFRIHTGDHVVNIPVSQEFAPFYAFGVGAAEASRGENKASTSLRVFSSLMDAYVPFRGLYEPDSDNHGMNALLALMPTLGQMPTQIATNRNSFGSQIVPDSMFTKDRPDNLKMNKGTKNTVYDKTAQAIASAGVAAGVADKYENDVTKISPETLKLLWANFAGGLGTFIADSASVTSMTAQDPGQVSRTDVPIVKDFVKPKDMKALRGRYSELTREARKVIAEMEAAKKAKDADAVSAILDDPVKGELARMSKIINSMRERGAAKRDEAVDIAADPSLTGPQKRAKLKELDIDEQELYRDAIEAFKN